MQFNHRLRAEHRELNYPHCLIGAICGTILGIFSIILAGRFFVLYTFLMLPRSAFPAIVFLIFFIAQFALCGAIVASLISCPHRHRRKRRNAALLIMCTQIALKAIWFPTTFGSLSFLFSVLIITLAAVICFYAIRYIVCVNAVTAIAALIHFIWLVYLVWFSLAIFLLN